MPRRAPASAGVNRLKGYSPSHLPCYVAAPIREIAGVAELVDALDLGSSDASRGGSSPSARTKPSQI
jgi:hypothetical protein